MDEARPAMRRGIRRAYIFENLGEPKLTETSMTDYAFTTFVVWAHDWNESKFPCTAIKMLPPDRHDVPEDDWFVSPCRVREYLFSQFPEAPIGTPMWQEEPRAEG